MIIAKDSCLGPHYNIELLPIVETILQKFSVKLN